MKRYNSEVDTLVLRGLLTYITLCKERRCNEHSTSYWSVWLCFICPSPKLNSVFAARWCDVLRCAVYWQAGSDSGSQTWAHLSPASDPTNRIRSSPALIISPLRHCTWQHRGVRVSSKMWLCIKPAVADTHTHTHQLKERFKVFDLWWAKPFCWGWAASTYSWTVSWDGPRCLLTESIRVLLCSDMQKSVCHWKKEKKNGTSVVYFCNTVVSGVVSPLKSKPPLPASCFILLCIPLILLISSCLLSCYRLACVVYLAPNDAQGGSYTSEGGVFVISKCCWNSSASSVSALWWRRDVSAAPRAQTESWMKHSLPSRTWDLFNKTRWMVGGLCLCMVPTNLEKTSVGNVADRVTSICCLCDLC